MLLGFTALSALLVVRVRVRARVGVGLLGLTMLLLGFAAMFLLALAVVRFALADLLFAIIAINDLALLLVYNILVVFVETFDMFLNVVSDIGHNNVVVDDLLLDSVFSRLDSVRHRHRHPCSGRNP
jgi:hypothetical protein